MMKYIIQGIIILACINVCHMGWVYFNKAKGKKQGNANETHMQKINETIDEVMEEMPDIEFCQVESELEEFMKSIISYDN